VAGVVLVSQHSSFASTDAASKPDPAPSFTLASRSGPAVALDSLRSQVVLVDFWASWCVPCRQSFPWMNALQERYGARGLRVVAINLDKERALADKFLAAHPATFTVAFDPSGKTAEAYRVAAMPSSFLISRDGKILVRHAGFDPKKTSELENAIAKACAP
jgi:thiol-disulfide isomerase/thioredoxin